MSIIVKYTVFSTKWGYFGIAGTETGLIRTSLPAANPEKAAMLLLSGLPDVEADKSLFKEVQEMAEAYFEGRRVDFGTGIPVILNGLSIFARDILNTCRDITFGNTTSYGRLAAVAGHPAAARAAGRVMAGNPAPLIIPCHRVVCGDGRIGGFSAAGGAAMKRRLLELEISR